MKDYNPLVSIIIPVYNGSNFLSEAIDSALGQTYQNIEIIVVNDGSNDNDSTEKIALSYGDKIRYFTKQNGGVSSALNLGIAQMKGDYFSWLSHDDKYTAEKIERQVDLVAAYADERAVVLCGCAQINAQSRYIKWRKIRTSLAENSINQWESALSILLKEGTFNGCALMVPRHAFTEAGVFDETLRYNQDTLMWIKILLKKYGIIYSSHIGVLSRVHEAQLTQTGSTLFHSDCLQMSHFLIPVFSELQLKENILFLYAMNNAKYNNPIVVARCLSVGEQKRLFSAGQIIQIKMTLLYGRVRPFIRRMYHRVFNHIKTQ